jgi:hypothetical protein
VVRGDVAEDGRERSYPKRIVVRNRDVVLRVGCSQVRRTWLPDCLVTR